MERVEAELGNNSFPKWLNREVGLRPNTIKMYVRYTKELPPISLQMMPEDQIRAILNSELVDYPNNVAKSAFKSFIRYQLSRISNTNPLFYDAMRVKKNSIIANLELPIEKRYRLDVGEYYLYKPRIISCLENLVRLGFRNTAWITLLLYDGGMRANEFLKNSFRNCDDRGIFISKFICKTHRDRYVEWLMPESREIMARFEHPYPTASKRKGLIDCKIGVSYKQLWAGLNYAIHGDNAFSPNYLRHTRISDLLTIKPLSEVSERAGHSDPKQTMYYKTWVAHREGTVETLEAYLKKENINLRKTLELS